jgi:excisionase family DNA binding protein
VSNEIKSIPYENQVFTPNEVAEMLKIHAQTVRKWIKEGKIKASKLGSELRITGKSINKFIDENELKEFNLNEEQNTKEFKKD